MPVFKIKSLFIWKFRAKGVNQVIEKPALPHQFTTKPTDIQALKEALEETKKALLTCKHPLIWAGHEILGFGLTQPLLDFAEKHKIPIDSSLLGKT